MQMKKSLLVLVAAVAASASAADLFFAGDSTLHPRRGRITGDPVETILGSWGDEVADYLKDGVKIRNFAWSGASTKSFIDSGRWDALLAALKPGDWVVIEFGHNDQKVNAPTRFTAADSSFRDNLRKFAKDVRAKGAEPIFASPIIRLVVSGGQLVDGAPKGGFHLNDYGRAAAAVAVETGAPFVDMNALTKAAAERVGFDRARLWYRAGAIKNHTDVSHPCIAGAKVFARLFVEEARARGLAVAALFKEDVAGTRRAAFLAQGMKTPETSKLFVKHVDPKSGVVSYFLKPGLLAFNQQSIYFTAKSMTDDGRFLVFDVSPDEFAGPDAYAVPTVNTTTRDKAVVDFLKDEAYVLKGVGGVIPWLDVERDQLWWVNAQGVHRRDLLIDPQKDIIVQKLPSELVWKDGDTRYGTHLTLSKDRKLIFLDARTGPTEREGCINLETGMWEEWGRARFCCNHGQINPVDPTLALCAMEYSWKMSVDELTPEQIQKAGFECRPFMTTMARPRDFIYPRLWLFRRGEFWMVRPKITNGATHEYFAEDGQGFYWCSGGVCYRDLKTDREWRIMPCGAAHSTMTADNRFLAYDCSWGLWWRGCGWTVGFWNRDTHRAVYIHSKNPVIAQKKLQSRLHPDPHPQFVCGDRYVVCTAGDAERRLNVSVTPVEPLVELTGDGATAPDPKRFQVAAWNADFPTDVPCELEIDVKALRDRGLLSEPGCRVTYDAYTAFALEAEKGGKVVHVPFDAVASQAFCDRVILRFNPPKGAAKLFYVADAPGRFEYYDSESCANLFARGMPHDLFPPKSASCANPGEDTAAASCSVPANAAGKPVKIELKLRNLAKVDWTGGVHMTCFAADGQKLGDLLRRHVEGKTFAPGQKRDFNEVSALPPGTTRLDLVVSGRTADGSAPAMEVQHLNVRVARVVPFDPPAP